MISTIEEDEPWDSSQDTTRTSNTAVKDAKEPLNDKENGYIEDYMPTINDIDSLADISGDPIKLYHTQALLTLAFDVSHSSHM